ncbi:serine hydrolase domain-containing protein [Nonomuraea rubra]|uniref:CubicO group peptidase (Beta-lactamase class C family) n=1 Tax=Nonomuraea rubra TaxID=46180 RepID=A0A7X0NVU8_9ACTN|nr:serine hydrolase domain-containing protein [Nonomuraea rubra]MBB6550384.1 CubicO group peptidase (beta-lactamase class C family) [Nonomuraea rubra]
MMSPETVQSWLDEHFARIVAERGVPGASVAVLTQGQVLTAAGGVLSRATGVEATTGSVFQIGSITKLWTSALVMQLVDEGLVGLDTPLRAYLPEFRVGDEAAAAAITIRQLLCHVAGFEGDIFTDTGRGEDAVEKYLASIHDIPQLFAPGEVFSYNNTGFVVLGRLVEVLRGKPFDEVLTERLVAPLGLTHVAPSPYEAILHRAAVGHVPGEDGAAVPAPAWALARSNAPAGSMLAMTPRDLLAFIAMHLADGAAPDGSAVLGPGTAAAMWQPQVKLPRLAGMGTAWGLGWEIEEHDGQTVVGHDGGTIGQAAFLRVAPEHGVAIALLTNGGDVFGIFTDVLAHLLKELTGVTLPGRPVPPAEPRTIDPTPYLGRYSDTIYDITVSQDAGGAIWLDRVPKDIIAEIGEKPMRARLVAFEGDSLISLEPIRGIHPVFAFIGRDDTGLAKYIHYGRVVARA